jgi:hypothetical protein
MNKWESEILKVQGKISFYKFIMQLLEFEAEDLEEALLNERIVNLCNCVEESDDEIVIYNYLCENTFDRFESKYELYALSYELSDAKLLYLCDTGKSYN